MTTSRLNVFSGPDAMKDFLNPKNHQPTPLIQLPHKFLGDFANNRIRLIVKCEYLVPPLLNVKMRQVAGMMKDAQDRGVLKGVHTLVEASSGSTAHVLPVYAKAYEIPNVEIIVSPGLAKGKKAMIALTGANIRESENGIEEARELGKKDGWHNLDQYGNFANPLAIKHGLAREIWEETKGDISLFVAGMGTTATVVGTSLFLKDMGSGAKVAGVLLAPDQKVPGIRTRERLQKDFGWEDNVDYQIEIGREASYKASRELCSIGILAGPSSGLALEGVRNCLLILDKRGDLSLLPKNKDGIITIVFICPDPVHLYVDE